MTYLEDKSFFFETAAANPQTGKPYGFSVVRFVGREAISTPYEFEITLLGDDPEVDYGLLLQNPATLYLRADKKLPVHGRLTAFEQQNEMDGKVFYRAVLRPRFWQLSLFEVSEVYLDLTVPEIIEKVLQEGGLSDSDYELRLVRTYRSWSFICQYQETHFHFLSRWMEREGIFYFFEQTEAGEKLIISDTAMVHVNAPDGYQINYVPASGLESNFQKESVQTFLCRQTPVPQKVTLQDFNHRRSPSVIQGTAPVSDAGMGEVMIYGEHVKTDAEATEYAKLRAEEILCRERVYLGEGGAPSLRLGYFFELRRHYRRDFNRSYLLTSIRHEGSQAAILVSGMSLGLTGDEQRAYYRNSFEAIEGHLQFRPERRTPKPRFYGTINAKVESEGDGQYAELDEFGRYKVKLPFDRSDRAGQKSSRWVRMAQPYAGPNEGMHFPLRKNTEVLLTFMDGDPDRPVIASAVPCADAPSMATDATASTNMLKSAGGNYMHFEDQDGKQRILLSSPTSDSWVRVGAPNDPSDPLSIIPGDSMATYSDSTGTWELYVSGAKVTSRVAAATDNEKNYIYRLTKNFDVKRTGSTYKVGDTALGTSLIADSAHTFGGYAWKLVAALSMADGATLSVAFYREKTVMVRVQQDLSRDDTGIRIRSLGNVWTEAKGKYADWRVGGPDRDKVATDLQAMWDKFLGASPTVVSGMTPSSSQIVLAKGDTIKKQEGKVFDFGATANYNFGGRYLENIFDGTTANRRTNMTDSTTTYFDRADAGGQGYTSISHLSGFTKDQIAVEKKFKGAEYDYDEEMTSVKVKVKPKSYEYKYGDSEEYKYEYDDKGTLSAEESDDGTTKKKTEYFDDGSTVKTHEMEINDFTYKFEASAKAEVSISTATAFSLEIKLNADAKVEINVGAEFGLKIAASAELKIEFSASLSMEIVAKTGGKYEIDLVAGKMEGEWASMEVQKNALIKAKLQDLIMDKATANLGATNMKIEKGELVLTGGTLKLDTNTLKITAP